MNQIEVPIDTAGRIVLPKEVRDELSIKAGDRLRISIQGNSVTLTPGEKKAGFVRQGKAFIFSAEGAAPLTRETVSQILAATREERDLRSFPKTHRKARRPS